MKDLLQSGKTRVHVNLIISTSNRNATGHNISDPKKKGKLEIDVLNNFIFI